MAGGHELVELLAKALRRARMGANDRGALGRLRGAGETFVDEPTPGFARTDIFPERLNDHGSRGPSVTRQRWNWRAENGMSDNDAAPYRAIGEDDLIMMDDLGNVHIRPPNSAVEKAQGRWGVDDPIARIALIGAGGSLSLREALRNQWSA